MDLGLPSHKYVAFLSHPVPSQIFMMFIVCSKLLSLESSTWVLHGPWGSDHSLQRIHNEIPTGEQALKYQALTAQVP